MNYKIVITLFLGLMLVSCASGIKVNSKYCKSEGIWQKDIVKNGAVIKKSISGFGIQKVQIKSLLDNQNIKCEKLKSYSVRIFKSPWQGFLSILPGYSSHSVEIYYHL